MALLALVGLFSMFLSPVLSVRADIVQNDVVAGGNDTITAGGSTIITYIIQVEGTGVDGQGGCNANDGSPATVTLSIPAGVTASSTSLSFTGCNSANGKSVTFSSNTPGNYLIDTVKVTDAGTGAYTIASDFTLHVLSSNTAPSLSLPANITGVQATSAAGAAVTYTVTANDAEDGSLTPSCSPASGSTFAIGTTTVNCSATDSKGVQTTGSFSVTVVDTAGPVLTLPASITKEATGSSGAAATFTVSASDVVDGSRPVTCDYTSGSTFPLGTTTVTCSATDTRNNSSQGTFTITVQDTTGPVVTVPSDITVEANGASGTVVNFTASATDAVDGSRPVTCNRDSGTHFSIGTTTVTCSATDTAGNTGQASFKITVQDTIGPVVTVPDDFAAEATSGSGAVVTFTATAMDAVDGARPVTCSPVSGSTFGFGATTVQCSATDTHGNQGTASFTVTVQDTTDPVLSLPDDVVEEATGPNGATVTFSASASDVVDGSVTPSCSPASGSTFALGTTTVDCSATDAHGNTATGSFTVTVQDTTDPEVSVPTNITKEATSSAGAVATFSASATDLVDGSLTPTCSPASGSTFALGTTSVTCSATDAHGNTGSASFDVIVQDTTAPALTLPADKTVEATSAAGATVSYTASASDIVDGSIAPSCSPAPGSVFALGTTAVTCSATDAAGNTATDSFDITVQDTTAPAITVPADITAEATGPNGAAVSFTASASDLVSGSITPTCAPASGSTFALGTTSVTCSATDGAGNTGSKGFTVTVRDTTGPIVTVPADITVDPTSASGAVVTYSGVSATDLVDGSVSASCDHASGSTFAIGTTTVTCSATDAAGNPGTKSFKVTVKPLTIVGFFSPVDMGGVYNTVKGGSTVPLKFKVYAGSTDISSTISASSITFSAAKASCTSGTEDAIEEFMTTGGTSLRYDVTAGQWIQNWATPKAAGTCYSVKVTVTNAGTPTQALFKLK